jgi:hypothetical protein
MCHPVRYGWLISAPVPLQDRLSKCLCKEVTLWNESEIKSNLNLFKKRKQGTAHDYTILEISWTGSASFNSDSDTVPDPDPHHLIQTQIRFRMWRLSHPRTHDPDRER